MSEYALVQKQSLTDIANALRIAAKLGDVTLTFPEDFIYIIQLLSTTTPTTESLTLSFVTGDTVYDSSSVEYSDYVCVGHSSNYIKNDAVWSFIPSINATKAIFTLNWDNTIGSVGWENTYTYRFQVSTSGAAGQLIGSGATEITLTGTSGVATVTVSGLNLTAGTTYYLRANYADYDTKQTLKAFIKGGNTVTLST